jgi:hypothetical protein
MILPGHVAAAVLCHRYLKIDLRLALVAGLLPDVVDKVLYYGLHLVPSSRVIMHTLWAWLGTTLLVGLVAWPWMALRGAPGGTRGGWRRWVGVLGSWLLGYGAHLLCDSPLTGGNLPFLYPVRGYDFTSPSAPLGFLFGLDDWPLHTLLAEGLLVAFTVVTEIRLRRVGRAQRTGQASSRAEVV